eukprot:TRINITY_DN2381_c0_g1_i2.p1 TRINITY_DN2381_c0_g1~~TRINITY_DN2381_c0_g1_i2.p1  ORF type:complete len:307 (+),score=103.71 TRINITY_DN2381_c0_g1_i2:115-1035(+)
MNLHFSKEVQKAIQEGRRNRIVALESTIISFGMPFPKNYETAKKVESIIREQGAVPATIAILNGVPHIGLDEEDLLFLADPETKVTKTSRRDIGYVIGKKLNGATTVSATMKFAALADIRLFVTGGIGGVHRNVESNLDISADLTEFSKTPVMVISAGAKAILDLPKTIEFIETMGSVVLGYQTDEFPSFYCRSSGIHLPHTVETVEEAASILHASLIYTPKQGILLANPIPQEFSFPKDEMDKLIGTALHECSKQGITGKDITPFLLKHITELSEGASLASNIELIYHNAKIGGQIAVAFDELQE